MPVEHEHSFIGIASALAWLGASGPGGYVSARGAADSVLAEQFSAERADRRRPGPSADGGLEDRMAAQAEKSRVACGDLGGLVAEFRGRLVVVPFLLLGTMVGFMIGHSGALPYVTADLVVGVAMSVGLLPAEREGVLRRSHIPGQGRQ